MHVLTRAEWDDLDGDDHRRKAFDSYDEYLRYRQATEAERAADRADDIKWQLKGVERWGHVIAVAVLAALAARGAEDLFSGF